MRPETKKYDELRDIFSNFTLNEIYFLMLIESDS